MVLLEAMSYGIPCIAYETASGVNDIITNNDNGYVVKNRNEKKNISNVLIK
ncbi:MAG: glycosyltransferase [Bacilli bacterium]|nr:MAG: glycosyltransferase [Bacilli bacterium]